MKPTKDELIEAVDAIAEHSDNVSSRLSVTERRLEEVNAMLEEIDLLIVRMNGPSTHYRDELAEISARYGFAKPVGP